MAGNYTTISAAVQALVAQVQMQGAAAFVEVLQYPTDQFAGFPAATVVPADVQSQYLSVAQNRRVYGFEVSLFVPTGDSDSLEPAFSAMRELVDLVLDALDRSKDLNGACDFLTPVPMRWEPTETTSGPAIVAPIQILAQKDIALY